MALYADKLKLYGRVGTPMGTDEIFDSSRGKLRHDERNSRRNEKYKSMNNIGVASLHQRALKGRGLRVEMKNAAIEFCTRAFPRGGFAD